MITTHTPFIQGVPELLVLTLLSRHELYGYELMQHLHTTGGDVLRFSEGTVYPLLHDLEQRGLLKAREDRVNGRLRRYYRTTAKGRTQLKRMASGWQTITTAVGNILKGGENVSVMGA